MGRGNWRPDAPARHSNSETYRNQVYVETLSIMEEPHEDFIQEDAYTLLKEVIKDALSSSFDKPTDRQNSDWFGGGFAVDTRAIFGNRQVLVVWDTDGDVYHQGVGVIVNPNAYEYGYGGLAEWAADQTFEKIKTALLEFYPNRVSIRTSAWTSARLNPMQVAA